MFLFSIGMLLFFMLGGALRAAGDARTPLRLGVVMTVLNIALQRRPDFRARADPGVGHARRGDGHGARERCIVSSAAIWMMLTGRLVVHFHRDMSWKPDWAIIRQLFRFGLPAGIQGVAMNIAGVLLLRFIGSLEHSAEAQAAYAVGYAELFSLITWTSVGLMGRRRRSRARTSAPGIPIARMRACIWPRGSAWASRHRRRVVPADPRTLLAIFGLDDPIVVALGPQLLRYLSVSGFFITVALTFTGGLQGTGDTRSPLFITLVSQVARAARHLLHPAGDGSADAVGRLDGDRPRPFHALRAVGLAVPTGQVEAHRVSK